MAKADRKPRRRDKGKKEQGPFKTKGTPDSLRLAGAEVVLAICVHDETDADGNRQYQPWIRGPYTNHTDADMIRMLAILCAPMVLGNAQHTGEAVGPMADDAKKVFGKALDYVLHRALSGEKHIIAPFRTVEMKRD